MRSAGEHFKLMFKIQGCEGYAEDLNKSNAKIVVWSSKVCKQRGRVVSNLSATNSKIILFLTKSTSFPSYFSGKLTSTDKIPAFLQAFKVVILCPR